MTLRNPRSSFLAVSLFSTLLVLSTAACSSSDPEDSGSDDDSSDGGGSDGDIDGSGGGDEPGTGGNSSGSGGDGGDGGAGRGDGGAGGGDGDTGGGGNSGDDDLDDDGVLDEVDVDVDGDGLVEVRTLAELDGIRFSLGGNGRATEDDIDTTGCPPIAEGACHGYELTTDLDFDTNGNGSADPGDTYYDGDRDGSARGWVPIVDFFADFDGNGHVIEHLFIDRPGWSTVGLFGSIVTTTGRSSGVRDLRLTQVHVRGGFNAGALAGRITNRNPSNTEWILIDDVYVDGSVISTSVSDPTSTGGLVGYITTEPYLTTRGARVRLTNLRFEGEVQGREHVGGLIGRIVSSGGGSVSVASSYVNGVVKSTSILTTQSAGGLVGLASANDSLPGASVAVTHSFAVGAVDAEAGCAGGLLGRLNVYNGIGDLSDSFSAVDVSSDSNVGGLVGCGSAVGLGNGNIAHNFVVGQVTGGEYVAGALFAGLTNGVGATGNHYVKYEDGPSSFIPGVDDPDASMGVSSSDLECPSAPNNDTCVDDVTLYSEWSTDAWSFAAGRLPGLLLETGTFWVEKEDDRWIIMQQL